jgi:hypothetical protein
MWTASRSRDEDLFLYGLGAELAAGGGDGDIAEALWAGLGGWGSGHGMELLQQVLGGEDEEEVDDGGDEKEVDDGGEEVTVTDLASINVADEVAEVRLADDGSQKWIDDLFCQRGHDGGEGGSNDDGHGQIDYVATQDEVAESLEHESVSLKSGLIGTVHRSSFRLGEYNAER